MTILWLFFDHNPMKILLIVSQVNSSFNSQLLFKEVTILGIHQFSSQIPTSRSYKQVIQRFLFMWGMKTIAFHSIWVPSCYIYRKPFASSCRKVKSNYIFPSTKFIVSKCIASAIKNCFMSNTNDSFFTASITVKPYWEKEKWI